MQSQPQLFGQALAPSDIVYTPEWAAIDLVNWFKPCGRILEPCMGDGAIFNHMPLGAEWCEIEKGKDFFAWSQPVDWIISNPPYSLLTEWLNHSYQIAENIVYLIPIDSFFVSFAKMKACARYGWLKHIRVYGVGKQLGFPTGKTMGAVHFKRSYVGATSWSWYAPNNGVHSRLATVAQDGQDLRTV